jgi:YD repeat-containing protein
MSYNRALQTNQVKLTLNNSVLQQYDFAYGTFNTSTGEVLTTKNNGQIGSVKAKIGSDIQWLQGFTYDELGRLSNVAEYKGGSMSLQSYSQGYTYDLYGNKRQGANSTLGLTSITASDYNSTLNNNQFASGVATYDAAGNITTDLKFRSPNATYAYDANGRQTSATNGTWTETQVYDSVGQRVQTTVGSTTRTMVYDISGQSIADYTGSTGSNLERENIYRGGQLLASYEASANSIKYVLAGSSRLCPSHNERQFTHCASRLSALW